MTNCLICGAKNTRGNHFGVRCCRACAVFFRRRAGTKYLRLKCFSENCGNRFCKPCRLNRCYAAGMTIENFQHNRDLIKSTIVSTFANVVGRPSFVIFCVPQESHRKTFVDLNVLIEKTSEIFEKGPENPYIGSTQLKKLAAASNFTMDWNRRSFEPLSHGEMSYFWEFYFLRTAKWLTYFEDFQKIPINVKIKLLLSFWHVFSRLDKLITTARARKLKVCSQQTWAMSNGFILDFDKTKVDFWKLSNYPAKVQFYKFSFLNSMAALDLQPQVEELQELEVSDVEFNFMLAQLTFSYAGKRLQGDILKICEKFQECCQMICMNIM